MKRFLLSMALLLAFCVPWAHAQTLLGDDFESYSLGSQPTGWDISSSTTSTKSSNPSMVWGVYSPGGNQMIRMMEYSVQNGTALINTPSITIPATASQCFLSFKYYHSATGSDFKVKISDDGGSNFTDLGTYSRDPNASSYDDGTSPGTFNEVSIDISSYIGTTIIIQFWSNSLYGYGAVYVDDVNVEVPPACLVLKTLTARASRTSVTANWTLKNGVENCAGFKVKLSSSSNPEDEGLETLTITDPAIRSCTFEHLERETQYYVHARVNCGDDDGESDWSTTMVTTGSLVDCQRADSFIVVNDGTDNNTYVPYEGYNYDGSFTQSQFIYPASMLTDVLGKTINKMTFFATSTTADKAHGGTIEVRIGLTTATSLSSAYETQPSLVVYSGPLTMANHQWVVDFGDNAFAYPEEGGNILVQVKKIASGSWQRDYFLGTNSNPSGSSRYNSGTTSTFLPKVQFNYCAALEACPAVDTVIISDSTQTTANVSWTAATGDYANTYDLLVSTTPVTDFSTVTPRHTGLTSTTDTLQGLSAYTDYYVYVRVNCDGYGHDDGEAWSEAAYFKTLSNCITPSNLAMELRGKTTGMVTWTATTQTSNYRYILSTTPVADPDNAPVTVDSIAADSVLLTGLTPGTHYYFYLSNECGSGDGNSPYMLLEFTTPDACIAPEDVAITDIQKYQMTLTWTASQYNDSTDSYDIIVSEDPILFEDEPVITYTGVKGNSKVLDTLQRNTLYYVYIRTNCGEAADPTNWVEVTETTADLEPDCDMTVAGPVFDGNTSQTNVPYNSCYNYGLSEQIYLASEMGGAATIKQISFKVASSPKTSTLAIYMLHTDKSSFSAWETVSASDLVYQGSVSFTTGWNTINLTTPFNYNGTDNLMLVVDNNTGGYSCTMSFYANSGHSSSAIYNFDDYTNSNPVSTITVSGTTISSRPAVKFGICGEAEACPTLKDSAVVSNVTNVDATLTWKAGKGDWTSSYDILLSTTEVTEFEGKEPTVSGITDTTYTFAGETALTPNTHYYTYVRVNCVNELYNDSCSDWSPACEFTTELSCLKPTDFVKEDSTSNSVNLSWVEKNEAEDWNIIKITNGDYDTIAVNKSQCTYSGDTIRYTYTGLQPETYYTFLLQTNCGEVDSLSQMAVGAPSVLTLSNKTDIDTIKISSAEVIGYVKDADAKTINITLRKGSDRANVAYEIDYSQYAYGKQGDSVALISPCDFTNPVTVKVYAQDTLVSTLWTITMVEEACATPYNFNVTDIQRRSAVLNWNVDDATATNFDFIISDTAVVDFAAWTAPQSIVAENNEGACTYALTGIYRDSTYYVYVRTNCGETFGQWRGDRFTTPGLVDCTVPENSTVNEGTATNSYIPFNGYNMDGSFAKSQFIYTDEMMEPLRGKTLKSMEFATTADKDYENARVTIKMGITTASNLTSAYQSTPDNLVYTGAVVLSGNKWKITFDNTFTYPEEGGNLLVQLDKTAGGAWQTMYFKGNTGLTGISRYTVGSSQTALDFLPMATFGYCVTNDACPAVDTVYPVEIGVNEVDIKWTPSTGDYANQYDIIVSDTAVTDFALWTTPTYQAVAYDTIYTIGSLTGYHNYYVYVRAICNGEGHDDGVSGWKGTTFLTESACEYPRNVVATMTGKTTARISWTDKNGLTTEDENFEYYFSTVEGEPTGSGTATTTGYGDMTGLANSTTYYCYVRRVCGDPDGPSPWIGTTITTVPAMPAVINLAASNISYNAFTATWESNTAEFADETEWEVCVVPSGDTPATWETKNTREHFALGLNAETAYDIYVRAKSGLEYSEVEYITVTTTALPIPCNYIVEKTSAATTTFAPVYSNWGSCYSIAIYTAEELAAKGFTAGTIESISYYQKSCSNTWSATTYQKTTTVWMGNTTKSSFDGNADWMTSGLTEVKSAGIVDFNKVNNDVTIPLDNTFEWDGVSNIAVAVLANSTGDYTSMSFTAATATDSKMIYAYQDPVIAVTGGVPAASYKQVTTERPDIQFCFETSACAKPNHIVVDQIATTTARAHWYPGGSETEWAYYVSTEELTDEQLNVLMHNGQTTDAYTTPVVDLTGLTKDMDYYFYVGIECDVPGELTDTLWTSKFFQTLPTCSAPITAQADNTGDNEITFDATAGQYGTVGTYDFRYWPVGTTDTTTVAGQVSQIVVNNVPGGDYDWEVRANCSGTDEGSSRWTAGNTVRVCGAYALPYTQGFEEIPTTYSGAGMIESICWNDQRAVETSGVPYYIGTTSYKTVGNQSLEMFNKSTGDSLFLIMPEFMNATDCRVSFDGMVENTSYSGDILVGYMTADSTFVSSYTLAPTGNYSWNSATAYIRNIPAGARVAFCHSPARSYTIYYAFLDNIVVDTIPLYNVAYTAAPAALGSVAMTCGQLDTVSAGVFYERTEPVFTATPETGMMFTNWTNANNGDTLYTATPWTFEVMQDTNIVANFDTASYNLTIEVADGYETFGTVEGSGTFKYMRNQQFSATAIPHYHVVWADGSYDAERTITMPAYDTIITATFAIDTFTVTTTQNVDSMGTITGAGRYTYDATATIEATPAPHHHFVEWSNGEITPQINIEVVKDTNLHATFRLDTVYVTALSNDDNLGQVSGFGYHGYNRPVTLIAHREPHYHVKNWSNGMTGDTIVVYPTGDTTITCYFVIDSFQVYTAQNVDSMGTVSGAATYAYGADVTVTATPAAHHHFVDWAVTGETATTLSFTMPDYDTTFTANFAIDQHTITPLSSDTTKGYVSAPITANYGETVIIAAKGIDPFQFARWSNGTADYKDDTLAVTVLGDETYTAYFKFNEYDVSVRTNDVNKGTVLGNGQYIWNTIDTLVALPAPNHHFIRWSNGSTDNPYYLTVTKDTVFTGYFGIDTFEVKALSNVAAMGTVTGGGLYEYNDLVTVTATPAANHHFLGWSNGATANTLTWNVTEDSLVIANFAIDRHTIAVGVNDVTLGTLTGAANGEYNYGTQFTLTATPATEHIHFVNWSDNTDVNPYALTLTQDTVITANFAYDQHTIALYTNNEDYGTVSGAGIYNWGTTVTITATPEANYHFVQWNDGVTTATRNILVGQDTMFVATFAIDRHVITVNVNDPNMGSTTGAGEYDYGTAVNLIATPANNHVSFDGWYLAGVLASNLDTFPIIVDNAYVYEARFAYDSHVIVIDVNGNGTVQGAGTHVHGTTVTLTATAAAHNHFVNWSNGSVNPSINVTVLADDTLTANFAIDQHIVTANVNDAALGSVNGGGTFNYGATATLTAVPADAHSVFAGWSDGTNANPYLLNVEGDTTVTAIFTVDSHVIAANVNGNGTVTGAGNYTHGTMVTLTANAGAHYHFVNWSNGATTNVISFVADNNYTLTANFAIDQHVVTAGVNDVTLGQVNGAGAYNYGASATLTAVPAAHSVFAGWSNGIISNPYTFTVNGDTTVTAIFTVDAHTIAANVNGNGTVSGAGNYTHGAMVTLTATPAANYHFVNWSNGATTNVISFVADDDYTYTANFAIDEHVVTLNTNNSTLGTVQGAGTYNYGTQVTVQAIPANAHVVFQGWSNGYTANPYSINLTSDTNLTAIFALDSHTLATMVNSAALGSVTGAGTYTHGDVATVTAVPAPHCHFVNWNTGSTYQSINLVMNNDTMFMAFFAVDEHSVTATPNDPTMGTITGTGTYAYGTTVTLTAVPAPHYHFVGWSNGATTPTINVNVGGDINLVATFAIDMHTITVNANDPTIGKTYGAGTFAYGTQASVMAVPEGCYSFISWSDGETVNPRTFTLEQDTVFTAIFDSVTYDIAVTVSNPLAGSAYITYRGKQSQAATVTCGYLVDITAVANKYYRFVEWSDGVTDATRTLNLTSDTNLVAVIEPACGEYSIVWNAELLYNGLIMLDIEDAQKVGYQPQPNEVSWYQVVNAPDPIEGVAFPTDDQFICHGFYLSLSQNNLGTGDYYAVVNVKNDTAVLCHDKMRSNVVSYVVDLNAPKVDLVPTNVKTGDIMTVTGLNPDEKTTIRIYDYAGKIIDVIETNGLENYDIQATGVAGVYMVKVTSETVNETLRFIVTK